MDSDDISKFCSITGVSSQEASHFLDAFNGNYDEAIKAFFDTEDDHLVTENVESSFITEIGTSNNNRPHVPAPDHGNSHVNRSQTGSSSRIATLHTIQTKSNNEADEGQAFYVGGAETGGGGQQVLGPPKQPNRLVPDPNESPETFVHNLFQAAKGKGAEVLDMTRYSEQGSRSKKQLPFSGTGYKLGEDPDAAPQVTSSPVTLEPDGISEQNVIVKMWRDGFSLDDGPLRSYTDTDARTFFDDIQAGQVPQEIARSHGGMVSVLLEDHHHEEWHAPPTPKVKPFSGTGHMLGFPTPRITQNNTPPVPGEPFTEPSVQIDDSKPVTQIQIRAPDGERLIIRLNSSHTIGDIRQVIIHQRPDLASQAFTLMTSYPCRELVEDKQTLEEANLLNSVLMIRLT